MDNTIRLIAEELYYLGGIMQAKYIDYDYISAMNDIQNNYRLYESNVVNDLSKKGLIEEDFSGDITIAVSMEELLRPVFFGDFEAEIDICNIREDNRKIVKLHTDQGETTLVELDENHLVLKKMQENDVVEYGKDIFSFIKDETDENIEFDEQKVSDIYILKNTVIGGESDVRILFRIGNSIFMENEEEQITKITFPNLIQEIQAVLVEKGA